MLGKQAGDRSPASTPPRAGGLKLFGWPSGRLPLGVKVLLPTFALTVLVALGATVFFTIQGIGLDRAARANEGSTVASSVGGILPAINADRPTVNTVLDRTARAFGNVSALCVLVADPADPGGHLVVFASAGSSEACAAAAARTASTELHVPESRTRESATGQVEETLATTSLSPIGTRAVIDVQVRLTPVSELAMPTVEKAAQAGLLLALAQTAVLFLVLWFSALRPLRALRLKAAATTRRARPWITDGDPPEERGRDEIQDLSLSFEEMLAALREREIEIVESHEKLDNLINNSPVIVFATDREGVLLQAQGNALQSIADGLGRKSLVGISVLDLVQGNQQLVALFRRALGGEKVHEVIPVRNWTSETVSAGPTYLDFLLTPTRDGADLVSGITGLAVNVSDRMAAASARAESDHKSAFLAAMSHELRTPLNSIMGFSQLLDMPASRAGMTDKQQRYVGHIYSSGEHLLALVSDLLDLAKVGAGQMLLNPEPVNVELEVEDVVDKMRPQAFEKAVVINTIVPPRLNSVTDRRRLRQILLNLLTNAVKFSPGDGGVVTVRASGVGAGVEIAVTDVGIGIAPAHQERIFEEFTQLDGGPDRLPGGTGLGLALTRNMTALMGGTIRVESVLGQGATFTVWLPGLLVAEPVG